MPGGRRPKTGSRWLLVLWLHWQQLTSHVFIVADDGNSNLQTSSLHLDFLDVEINRKLGLVVSSFTLQNTPALQVSTSLSIRFSSDLSRPNWSFKMLFFKERRKLEKAKKKLSEQGRVLTSISTHMWCRFRDSVTGHREKYLISFT